MANQKATPTEYKGITFRSKSEAVFARCLDLSPSVKRWDYETPKNCKCPHVFDFMIGIRGEYSVPILIEYKPTRPTDTYVQNLLDAMVFHSVDELRKGRLHMECWIIYGSPWKPVSDEDVFESIGILSYWTAAPFHDVLRITPELAEEAKSYRFDLQQDD